MGLLEVIALHAADVQRAEEGGADRVELFGTMDEDGPPPEPVMVAKVRHATSIRIRPVVRSRTGFRTDGGEPVRLRGLAASHLDEGVNEVVLGLLNGRAGIDLEVCNVLTANGDFAWIFHRVVDNCPGFDDAWEDLATLPCFGQALTAGSARGAEHGPDELLGRVRSNSGVVRVTMAGGGLRPEHVPRLIRAGVWAFHTGSLTRPGGSYKAYVDPNLVRTWRGPIDKQTVAVRRSR